YYVRAHAGDALPLSAEPDGNEDPLATVEQMVGAALAPSVGFADSSPKGGASDTALAASDPPPLGEGDHAQRGGGGPLSGLTPAEIEVVADAVRDHYKPLGPSDSVPTAPVTVAVALADKLDTLVGFFAIDERPTGSKDPYALRRAALGVIRLVLESGCRLALTSTAEDAYFRYAKQLTAKRTGEIAHLKWAAEDRFDIRMPPAHDELNIAEGEDFELQIRERSLALTAFFADRLKGLFREEGKRHDLVDAVFALGDDDLVRMVRTVEALSAFLATEDGASLLAGYKRAANILRAEAKKTPDEDHQLNESLGLLAEAEEQALSAALRTVQGEVDRALEAEDFEAAMRHLAHLRAPVDSFFDKVLVNAPDPALRLNRLRLLSGVRDTANRVADFSLVGGG
uniref:glycine--tRNA ligase subunit beta n=1 Tax=Caulobacter sp. S45 TaxID=1641861 RepID=UPI0015771843